MINIETLITVSITAIVMGASNTLGIWIVSTHLIKRLEKAKKEKKLE